MGWIWAVFQLVINNSMTGRSFECSCWRLLPRVLNKTWQKSGNIPKICSRTLGCLKENTRAEIPTCEVIVYFHLLSALCDSHKPDKPVDLKCSAWLPKQGSFNLKVSAVEKEAVTKLQESGWIQPFTSSNSLFSFYCRINILLVKGSWMSS